ncbi:ankyrin repeat-containing protein At5g02620 isoform X1 [Eutrema salsugineum]|uniref:ankyrin repeat-containing protein At5g02620 isoform X1 n=1 Tax=Eutrema salsugineum TaxID=72664 RepID=UPI000CED7E2D|nr:ankyrin repeat-containing protein At5g02620 isoform X1 [Eutrema salsugineum]XP_024011899.1 ankyrin repeat-containing protein At5g02620 isoform X1 [Eutrema salsugineum]
MKGHKKTMTKQTTARRDDTPLLTAVREGNTELILQMIGEYDGVELKELLAEQNQSGETALYVAAESGHTDMVKILMKHSDSVLAGTKAKNGFDAFHIAAKNGNLKILDVLMEANPELSFTFDSSKTTALHTAASQGHGEIVCFLLDKGVDLAAIARSNGKTALHSAARNGHTEIVKELLGKKAGMVTRVDKKGQTALHMAVKGQNAEIVDALMKANSSLINAADNKGNTPLHIAVRKNRAEVINCFKVGTFHESFIFQSWNLSSFSWQIVQTVLKYDEISRVGVNKSGETALDIAEKTGLHEIVALLQKIGMQNARSIKPAATTETSGGSSRKLKETVSEIGHEVHTQLEHTGRTRREIQGIAKRVNKMHTEGLNNAINSTTVVAILIATVAFAAIFNVPGQFTDDPNNVPPGYTVGEARAASRPEFLIFVVFDSFALFISLAVVVVQTSVVVIERKAKKQMMAIINKLMWMACIMISVAFLSLSFVVVGDKEKPLAIGVTAIGALIMVSTLGTMCYWVVANRIEGSKSSPASMMSDPELVDHKHNRKLYAV